MKGLVFTEFIEFVEEKFGFDTVDLIIDKANLPSKGVYTQAAVYPDSELLSLLGVLSDHSGKSVNELLESYGRHVFHKLLSIYPTASSGVTGVLDFISRVDSLVHVEVKKLYPDAQLPKFSVDKHENNEMVLIYQSQKRLEALAKGMMLGCAEHYGQNLDIKMEKISEDPHTIRFDLKVE